MSESVEIEKTCTLTLPFRSFKIYILPIKLYAMIEYFNYDLIFFPHKARN